MTTTQTHTRGADKPAPSSTFQAPATLKDMKDAKMSWFEIAARLKGNPALADRKWMFAEVLMSDGKNFAGITKVGFMQTGAPYRSGSRKGEPRFLKGTEVYEFVTDQEVTAVALRYEQETGRCKDCRDGQCWAGWNIETGNSYKPCGRCGATGKAPVTP